MNFYTGPQQVLAILGITGMHNTNVGGGQGICQDTYINTALF